MKPQDVVPAGGAGAKPGRGAVLASQDHAPDCGSIPPALTALPRARLGLRECPYGIYHHCPEGHRRWAGGSLTSPKEAVEGHLTLPRPHSQWMDRGTRAQVCPCSRGLKAGSQAGQSGP